MAKAIHRGETKLIRIKSPNADRPVSKCLLQKINWVSNNPAYFKTTAT